MSIMLLPKLSFPRHSFKTLSEHVHFPSHVSSLRRVGSEPYHDSFKALYKRNKLSLSSFSLSSQSVRASIKAVDGQADLFISCI